MIKKKSKLYSKKWIEQPWVVLVICLSVFTMLYLILGFASGYGQVIDGQVSFIRRSLFSDMLQDYGRDGGEWGFGYFVPLAVLGLFWTRRKELLMTRVDPQILTGGTVLIIGFALYWAGYRGEQKIFGYAAGQILVAGAILWFLGWVWFRKVFWLWALLGMMWPWRFLIEPIANPLQKLLAILTAFFLKLIGIGAVASGSSVSTDTQDPITGNFINLDIDIACSGMRSLFALIMIGMVFAFLRVKDEWKRWVLMACVPFIAVAGNFVRMLMLYFGSRIWGTEFAIGKEQQMSPYHMLAGLAVFAVALVLMTVLVDVLEKGKRFFKRRKAVKKSVVTVEAN